MSYTVVIDETERRRMTENRINIAVRHCKIGKVREKTGIPWMDRAFRGLEPPKPQPTIPGDFGFVPWHLRGPWCAGNAA